MKKSLLIAAAGLLLASCNGGSDTTTEQQSTVVFNPQYKSADLAMQELKGQVKEVQYYNYECDEDGKNPEAEDPNYEHMIMYFFFDENGTMTKGYAYNKDAPGPKLVRNEKGQIEHFEEYFKQMDFTFVDKFTYNENGNIDVDEVLGYEGHTKTTFKYDENCTLTSSETTQSGEGVMIVSSSTYTVVDTDAQGNWTRRLMKMISKEGHFRGEQKIAPSTTSYTVEVRKIIYY